MREVASQLAKPPITRNQIVVLLILTSCQPVKPGVMNAVVVGCVGLMFSRIHGNFNACHTGPAFDQSGPLLIIAVNGFFVSFCFRPEDEIVVLLMLRVQL